MTTRTRRSTGPRLANLTVLVAARLNLLDAYAIDPSPANTRALNNVEAELDRYDWCDVDAAMKALGHEPEPPTTVPVPMVARQPVAVSDLAADGDSISSNEPLNPIATANARRALDNADVVYFDSAGYPNQSDRQAAWRFEKNGVIFATIYQPVEKDFESNQLWLAINAEINHAWGMSNEPNHPQYGNPYRRVNGVSDLAATGDSLSSASHPIQFDRNPVATYSAWNEQARRFEPIDLEVLTTAELPEGSGVLESIPGETETLWIVQAGGTMKLFDLGAGFDAATQETAIDHLVAHQFNKTGSDLGDDYDHYLDEQEKDFNRNLDNEIAEREEQEFFEENIEPNLHADDDSNDLVFISEDLHGDALVLDPLPPDIPDDVFIDRLVVVIGWTGAEFTAFTDGLTSDGSAVIAHLYSPDAQQWQRTLVQADQIIFLNGVTLEQENLWAKALRRLGCRPEALRCMDC